MNENQNDRDQARAEQVEDPERQTTHGDQLDPGSGRGTLADEAIRLGAVEPLDTDADDDDADPDLPAPAPGSV